MKTKDFIDALEQQKIVPGDIVKKLRSKIEKTDKDVSAKSIAMYLIDKGYLSKYQAKQILTGAAKPVQEELDLEVPAQQVEDTNELLKDLNPAANVDKPKPEVTRTFNEQDVIHPHTYDADIDVVNVEVEQTMLQGMEGTGSTMQAGGFDPLTGQYDGGFTDEVEEAAPLDSFSGKKVKKNQWDSKWIFIGSSVLALLIMVGVILAFTIFKADSAKMWEAATKDFNNGRYSAAIGKLQSFIDSFPGDDKVYDAKVMIANCELRIPYDSKQWETTLKRATSVLPVLDEELKADEKAEKFSELRPELGVILPGTAIGFTEKGLDSDGVEDKQRFLGLAEEMNALINDPNYVPGSTRRTPGVNANLQLLTDNISKIKRQIEMEHDYSAAVDAMLAMTEQGDTREAFETFEQLTSQYPELRTREEIQQALLGISLREAELVKAIDIDLAAVEPAESPVSSSVVLATRSGQNRIPGLSNEMLVYLIDGSLYGLQAVDGNVAWRKFVGIETMIPPTWLEDENKSDVVAVDSREHDLMRLSARDGSEVWRINIGEPFARPHVSSIGLLVSTYSGKVMVIDPQDGSVTRAAEVPKQLSVSGVMIEGLPFIYQLANDSNLYVISTETMTCREVFYLGHDASSVSVSPFVISGHLLVPVNAADYCNLQILRPLENGLKLGRPQVAIRLNGQVNTPITRYNRWALVMSDKGDMRMLEVNKAEEAAPVSEVVSQKIANKRMSRKYLTAFSGNLWLCSGSGLRRFKIQRASGVFKEESVANNLDTFVGPGFVINEVLFHIRRRHESSLVSVSAVDAQTLEELWRTDFAAPLAGPPIVDGSAALAISAQGDIFDINSEVVEAGVSNQPISRGSTVVQSLVFNNVVDFGNKYVMTGPLDRNSILAVDLSQNPPSKLTDLRSPADRPSCAPVAFGNELLVATRLGQVFRINTQTGQPVGAPFQPALSPNTETLWRRPAVLNDQRFMIGDSHGRIFLVEADGDAALQKLGELEQPGDLLSPLVRLGDDVFGVTRDDSGDRLVAFPIGDEVISSGDVDLPAGYVAGPIPVSDELMILLLDSGETICFDSSMQQQWSATLPPDGFDEMVGQPHILDGRLVMAFASGKVLAVDPRSGDVTGSIDLGQPIAHPPVDLGGQLFVTGADGTLHKLNGLSW